MLRSDGDLPWIRRRINGILGSFGIREAEVRVTPWSIALATRKGRVLYTDRIQSRSRNLSRLRKLGALSRAVTTGDLRGVLLWESLQLAAVMADLYPVWLRTVATSIAAGALMLLTASTFDLVWPVLLLATAVQVLGLLGQRLCAPRWLENLVAGVVSMLGALWFSQVDPGLDPTVAAAGGLIPLVPGILSETIMVDLLAADLRSTASRVVETIWSAAPLAAGVLLVEWLVTRR